MSSEQFSGAWSAGLGLQIQDTTKGVSGLIARLSLTGKAMQSPLARR